MKYAILLATTASASLIGNIDIDDSKISSKTRFSSWMKLFNKPTASYETWLTNDQFIQTTNKLKLSYTVGHNEFSDLSWEDFSKSYTGLKDADKYLSQLGNNVNHALSSAAVKAAAPASVDWSKKNAVTPIKNQGQCGSCWAFSTTGSTEGAYAIASGKLVSLSEQMLVDCDKKSDQGCNGGLMDNAFEYIQGNGGICKESDYPYTAADGTCQTTCVPAVTLTGHHDVPAKDEDALAAAVAIGPVSVAIEADKSAFQFYKSGVFNNAGCGTQLDHGVLAVGYGTLNGTDYWKVKNSWGAAWGNKGYILLEKGKNNQGECGIKMQPSYPVVSKQTVSPLEGSVA